MDYWWRWGGLLVDMCGLIECKGYWWRCGGPLVEMWWLIGRDVVAHW